VNYQVLQPYSYLMFPIYGGGNNTFNADGTGELSDGFCYAGRLDYAVASNLNVFGSYIWAHRLENAGTLAGSYLCSSDASGSDNSGVAPFPSGLYSYARNAKRGQAWKSANTGVAAAGLNPFVDDGFLGWEAQAGFSWKLLEGLTFNCKYAYWQPGDWFTQAYRAFSQVGSINAAGALTQVGLDGQGMLIGRDAIHAMDSSFLIEF
jgi:hypothetical protein